MKESGENMKRVALFLATAVTAVGLVAIAAPAQANTCRESIWGDDMWGNKRYDCSDGSYTLKKPLYQDRWDDPFTTYELESDSYGSNKWTGKCKYSSFGNSYECRGQSKNRYR